MRKVRNVRRNSARVARRLRWDRFNLNIATASGSTSPIGNFMFQPGIYETTNSDRTWLFAGARLELSYRYQAGVSVEGSQPILYCAAQVLGLVEPIQAIYPPTQDEDYLDYWHVDFSTSVVDATTNFRGPADYNPPSVFARTIKVKRKVEEDEAVAIIIQANFLNNTPVDNSFIMQLQVASSCLFRAREM